MTKKDSERMSVEEAAKILGVYRPAIYMHMAAKGADHWDIGYYSPPKKKGGHGYYVILRRKFNKFIGIEDELQ